MRIAVASDHAGFCQKADLIDHIIELGHSVEDFGPETDDRVDYPDFAAKVAHAVANGEADYGVLICGTGIGMAMAADKVPGIRAQAIQTPEFAQLMREHNDGNVLCLSGRFVSEDVNKQIIDVFLSTAFGGGRHADRVAKIMQLDSECAQ